MQVHKFGGASIATAAGFRQVAHIVRGVPADAVIVVSAMGKMTNALEEVWRAATCGDEGQARERLSEIAARHEEILAELMGAAPTYDEALTGLQHYVAELSEWIAHATPNAQEADRTYDRIVGYGELLSSQILSCYLQAEGLDNQWIDIRAGVITDDRFRQAEVDLERSGEAIVRLMPPSLGGQRYVTQGFIAATAEGEPTTLGREGSDYSAALVAYLLGGESVTIWKDVAGVLSADPKLFAETELVPELSYLDAIELAYSGAQVIHPKTIKPLQNQKIPLYVRPFSAPEEAGSRIGEEVEQPIATPLLILKCNQVLVSIRPQDFSFVLEDQMAEIFGALSRFQIKVNLIQTSAVNLSLCVDASDHLAAAINALKTHYRVVYNDDVELLTIRGYDAKSYAQHAQKSTILLEQRTRRTLRLVRLRAMQ